VIAKSEQFLGELVDKLDLVHDPDFAGRGRTEQEARAATVENLAPACMSRGAGRLMS